MNKLILVSITEALVGHILHMGLASDTCRYTPLTLKNPRKHAYLPIKKHKLVTTDQKVVGSTPTGCAIDNQGLT
jgi:hypothetical protein